MHYLHGEDKLVGKGVWGINLAVLPCLTLVSRLIFHKPESWSKGHQTIKETFWERKNNDLMGTAGTTGEISCDG